MTLAAANILPAQSYLPHEPPMLLLDRIVETGDDYLVAETTLLDEGIFAIDGKTPSYIGIELMAQAMAAFIGHLDIQQGNDIKIAFLLGTRHYHCESKHFPHNQALTIRADKNLIDESGIGIFDCTIHCGNELLATAQVKGIQPTDLEAFNRL
jgi:predicted hotdog family 3-hydroxylacyl-ACP dehydratase